MITVQQLITACALGLCAQHVLAETYPSKPIRMVIPFAAAGFSDVVARLVGQKLSESVGQPVVIDNRPGASGILGTDIVAKSQPDGYTLLLNSFNHVVNPALLKPPFDPISDFSSVSLIADGPPLVMMVFQATPVKSVKELIDLAKSRPGQLNYGSTGIGTSGHLIGELFKLATGVDMVHVPYRGSGASMTAVVGGEVTMVSTYMPVALPLVRAGRLRALAVTGARRSTMLPEAPTMSEAGVPGVVLTGFAGMMGPAGTPKAIVGRLNAEVVKMAKDPDFVNRYASYDMNPIASTPEAFVKYLREEIAQWSRIVKTAGIRLK
jgi:tripartite-type tricarboxylate transporter receptor subunit TctC